MKLKYLSASVLAIGLLFMIACKSKPKDSDIQANVATAIQPISGVTADVKDGVVTLTGTVISEEDKTSAENAAKTVKDVKSVNNEIMVAPPPPPPAPAAPVAVTADDSLRIAVTDVVKDFPTVKVDVKDGVLVVTGEEKADRWKTLKMALDALHPKKVDASGLKVK